MFERLRLNLWLYLLIAPALLYFALFVFLPLGQGLVYSVFKAGLGGLRGFVGLDNYLKVLTSPVFVQATINTVVLAAGITVLGTALPLIPAIALAEITPDPLKRLLQTTIYTPYLLSWVIIVGVWSNTLSPIGLVNSLLIWVHLIDRPIAFFATPFWARPLVVGLTVWKDVGFHALIYYSALLSLDENLLDAAALDGASASNKIRYIVLPHLRPMIALVAILTLQGSLHTFDSVLLMLNGRTSDQILTLAVFSYQRGVLQFDLGVASASATMLLLLCLVVAAIAWMLTPRNVRV